MIEALFTIGVYGFSEEAFFHALTSSKIDVFCDLRSRRGMRGATYAFVNSSRLQHRLSQLGIRYWHIKELAPTDSIRDKQRAADAASGTLKRERTTLGEAFIQAYKEECLTRFNTEQLVSNLDKNERRIALFCVEQLPSACHRSLVADRLTRDLKIQATHLTP